MPSRARAVMRIASTPPGVRQLKKAVTRNEILRAARKLFGERGLYESRIEDMTDRARIAKGTLYLYFRSKEDLIHAVTVSALEEMEARVHRRSRTARSLKEMIEEIVRAQIEFFEENPDLMRILHQVRGLLKFEHRKWRSLRYALTGHLDRLADRMGAPGLSPRLPPARRRAIATLLFGGVSGTVSVHATTGPPGKSRRLPAWTGEAIAAMALAGISKRSAAPDRFRGR